MFIDKAYAATSNSLGSICGTALGPFGECIYGPGDGPRAVTGIASIVSSIVGVMTLGAGIWFLFQVIIGGFSWITSGGDKSKLETARHRINDAFIGLVVVVAGWGILALASQFFNTDFSLNDPFTIIQHLKPKP